MLRAVGWTLRQRRYAVLAAVMLVIALGCAAAGSFEVHRFLEKRHDNRVLVANADAPVVPLTTSLLPVVGTAPAPDALAVRYCRVSVTGRFLGDREQYVDGLTQDGAQGFAVLTPFASSLGTVLVLRGFVAARPDETRPASVPRAPTGTVRLVGRLDVASTRSDDAAKLPDNEIASVNATAQAARLGGSVLDGTVTLGAGQPGTDALAPLPGPDRSNPTGGAGELQLLSYVVQWYAFCVLALLAPFFFSRAELREARKKFLGVDDDARELDEFDPAPAAGGALVLRSSGALVVAADADDPTSERYQRAERLADRYGQSLGPVRSRRERPADATRSRPVGGVPEHTRTTPAASVDSRVTPHRAADDYHGDYNDYLWQLALADGDIDLSPDVPGDEPRREPRVIDGDDSR